MMKYLIALTLAGTALYGAGTQTEKQKEQPQPTRNSSDVYLAHPNYYFAVEGAALYLQPTGSNLHYAAEANPLPTITPNWKIHGINPSYHFGFDVALRGISHCTSSNLVINWERLHSSDSSSKQVPSTHMIGPMFEIGPDAEPYKKARGKATFHFDEVNLGYGTLVNFGSRLNTDFFGGLTFTRIKETLFSRFSNLSGTIVRTIKTPSTFMGGGLEFGTAFGYRIAAGFHLTGKARGLLVVGPQKNHTNYTANSPLLATLGGTSPNKQSTQVHKKTQVVPGFEAKLGLSYVVDYCKQCMFKVEGGYQVQTYIDAIQSVDIGSEVVTPPVAPDTVGVYARTFKQTQSNFSLAGPYLLIALGF